MSDNEPTIEEIEELEQRLKGNQRKTDQPLIKKF